MSFAGYPDCALGIHYFIGDGYCGEYIRQRIGANTRQESVPRTTFHAR